MIVYHLAAGLRLSPWQPVISRDLQLAEVGFGSLTQVLTLSREDGGESQGPWQAKGSDITLLT